LFIGIIASMFALEISSVLIPDRCLNRHVLKCHRQSCHARMIALVFWSTRPGTTLDR
jgi:hypothetical protein